MMNKRSAGYFRRVYLFVTIVSLTGLFVYLESQGFQITAPDEVQCNETTCVIPITIRNPTSRNFDIYNRDQIQLSFSPDVKDFDFYTKDGRIKKGAFPGWRLTDFTDATKPRKDRVYVFRWARYSTREHLLVVEKVSLFDTVKWTMGTDRDVLDPLLLASANHTRGQVKVGERGFFQANDSFKVEVSTFVATTGEAFDFEVTNLFGRDAIVTCGVQTDDLVVKGWKRDTGRTEKVVTAIQEFVITGTVNKTQRLVEVNKTVFVPVYQDVPSRVQEYDGRTWLVSDFDLSVGSFNSTEIVLKPKQSFAQNLKYSILCNSSNIYIDFDPALDDNLVNYWDLEGDYEDIFGNEDLIPGGLQTFLSTGSLNEQYLNSTNGDNTFLTVNESTLRNLTFTFSFWYQLDGVSSGQGEGFFNQYLTSGDPGFFTDLVTGNNWWVDPGYVDVPSIESTRADWTNMVVVFDATAGSGDGFARMYINGSSVATNNFTDIGAAKNLTFLCGFVGGPCPGTTDNLGIDGRIDEIAIWNRLLDSTDATDLWNGGVGLFCTGDPCQFLEGSTEPLRIPVFELPNASTVLTSSNVLNWSNSSINHSVHYYRNGSFIKNFTGNSTLGLPSSEANYCINLSSSNDTDWTDNVTTCFTHDNITSLLDFVANTPLNASNQSSTSITVNFSFGEIYNHTALIQFDGVNHSDVTFQGSGSFFKTFTGLSDRNHNFSGFINDTIGNTNESGLRFVITDTEFPVLNFTAPTPDNDTTITINHTLINFTFFDLTNASTIVSFDNINYTPTCFPTYCYSNITNVSDGRFDYYAWMNDTFGRANQTETRTIVFDSVTLTLNFCLGTGDIQIEDFEFRPNSSANYNITHGNLTEFDVVATNVTQCLFNTTNTASFNQTLHMNQSITDPSYVTKCNNVTLSNVTFLPVINVTADTSVFFNCTIDYVNATAAQQFQYGFQDTS